MKKIRVASVQFEHASGDKDANFEKIEQFSAQAAAKGVNLVAFPEGCITGYWFLRNLSKERLEALAEPVPSGSSTKRLIDLSSKHGMMIGAGLIEKDSQGRMYNSYIVAMPDGQWKCHRKIQAFEHDCILPGDSYTVFETPHGWKIGVLICYDNNIIENARITALMGADVLVAPHQTGGCNSPGVHAMKPVDKAIWANRKNDPEALRREFMGQKGRGWIMRWLPSRAHDNGMFVIFSNGVGQDDDEVRTGNAMILDPYGRTLAESTSIEDDMVIADLDPELLSDCNGRRWMRARRPDLYMPLTLPLGIERPTRKIRFEGRSA